MANVISLHKRQVFLASGTPAAYAKFYVFLSGTTTQVTVYADVDLTTPRAQPVSADANGVFPPCFVSTADPLRHLVTDENDVPLPGYPQDRITPEPAQAQAANTVTFSPSELVPETNVQDAIDSVAGRIQTNDALVGRPFVPFVTGGSGNAYTITPSPTLTAYANGVAFTVRPNRANTGASTINVSGLGARNLQKTNAAGTPVDLAAGELQPGREFLAVYDGVRFLITLGRDYPIVTVESRGTTTRWANGQQRVWTISTFSAIPSIAPGAVVTQTWNWPQPFLEGTRPFVTPPTIRAQAFPSVIAQNLNVAAYPLTGGNGHLGCEIAIANIGSVTVNQISAECAAEGRWL